MLIFACKCKCNLISQEYHLKFKHLDIRKSFTFMTSLDVIREVMNVPMEAIHAIARMNGISTADDHERNISESAIQPFIEAFERKTRNYFVNSMRNRAQLTPQELQTFTEFCKTFKKGNVSLGNVRNWSHIGKTKLREFFVERIKEKTSSSQNHHMELDLFSGCGGMVALIERAINSVKESLYFDSIDGILLRCDSEYASTEYRIQPSRDLLCQINSSWQYRAKIESEVCYSEYVPDFIKRIILSARYYVYIDDDDHHLYDTVSTNGFNVQITNSTLKMVA